MDSSQIPGKFQIPFANGAGPSYIRAIPQASQIGITPGAASLTDGFPPLNFLPVGGGGIPPFGQDFNGLLNQITLWSRWQAAGGTPIYDSGFAAAIGGYPVGAILSATSAGGLWLCVAENNATDPDAGGAGWIPIIYSLLAPKNFYVSTTGSDSNNGTSALTPFATLQKAADQIPLYNLNGYSIVVNVADGTYAPVTLKKINGSGTVSFVGNVTTPANCIISATNRTGVIGANLGGSYLFDGFTYGASGTSGSDSISGIAISGNSSQFSLGASKFLSCVGAHMAFSAGASGSNKASAAWTIAGGCAGNALINGAFLYCYGNATFQASSSPPAITVSTPITYGGAFVEAYFNSFLQLTYASLTGGGGVTGKRYDAAALSVISTAGGGANYYPGTVAGTTSTGSQYI